MLPATDHRPPEPTGELPRDDPILAGEMILDRAREVAHRITARAYSLAAPDGPPPLAAQLEQAASLLDAARRAEAATVRLLACVHPSLADSQQLVVRAREFVRLSRTALAPTPEERAAAAQFPGLVPEFAGRGGE